MGLTLKKVIFDGKLVLLPRQSMDLFTYINLEGASFVGLR